MFLARRDGSFQVFNTFGALDPHNMSERQIQRAEQVIAFAIALKHPPLMNKLLALSKDPDGVGQYVDMGRASY